MRARLKIDEPSLLYSVRRLLLFKPAFNFSGVAGCHAVVGNVVDDHASGCNDASAAYCHTWADDYSAAQPAVFAYADRQSFLFRLAPFDIVRWVVGSVKLAIRPYVSVCPDADASAVEHCAVVVDEDVLAKMNFSAVVAMKRWANECRIWNVGYELFDRVAIVRISYCHGLQTSAYPLAADDVGCNLRVGEVVHLLTAHLVDLLHVLVAISVRLN